MSVDWLLDAMFPGDPERQMPSFSELGVNVGSISSADVIRSINEGVSGLALENADVNEILRALRKSRPETAQFIEAALRAYFTSSQVVRTLRGGTELLFPTSWNLPDIDFSLLEPVFTRGFPSGGS